MLKGYKKTCLDSYSKNFLSIMIEKHALKHQQQEGSGTKQKA